MTAGASQGGVSLQGGVAYRLVLRSAGCVNDMDTRCIHVVYTSPSSWGRRLYYALSNDLLCRREANGPLDAGVVGEVGGTAVEEG